MIIIDSKTTKIMYVNNKYILGITGLFSKFNNRITYVFNLQCFWLSFLKLLSYLYTTSLKNSVIIICYLFDKSFLIS